MLCADASNSSLMSIDNSSSSEPIKKFSPVKIKYESWWEEVEAAQQIGFQGTDDNIKCKVEKDKQIDVSTKMDSEMLTFANKIKVDHDKDDKEIEFLDRTIESTDSNASSSREIKLEFLDTSNEYKYDRLMRDVKLKTTSKRRLSGDSRSNSPTSLLPIEREEPIQTKESIETEDENVEIAASSSNAINVACGRGQAKRRRINQPLETNVEVLARRQKQIDYGKNTIGYDNYIKQIPRNKRSKDHPWTPPKQYKYSRRAFDGLVKIWRTKLHCFDPPNAHEDDNLYEDVAADDYNSGSDSSSENYIGEDKN